MAGDEVYGSRELRRSIRGREMGYVLAVRANHALTVGSGRAVTAAGAVSMIPRPRLAPDAHWLRDQGHTPLRLGDA